jgi:hypothetical protein
MYQYAVAPDGQPAAELANATGSSSSSSAGPAGPISAEEDDFVPRNFPSHRSYFSLLLVVPWVQRITSTSEHKQ